MTPTDEEGRSELARLGPLLPLPVATELMRGVAEAASEAGCTDVAMGPNLAIVGKLPHPGHRPPETHRIKVKSSEHHSGFLAWECSCFEEANHSYTEVSYAIGAALDHIPGGERWIVRPADELIIVTPVDEPITRDEGQ